MKKHVSAGLIGVMVLVGAAGVLGSRFAYSQDIDTKQLQKDIDALIEGQKTILAEIQTLKEELNIVKIRCSS